MPLCELQTALAMLVQARASRMRPTATLWPALEAMSLSRDERAWLDQVAASPGFEVTCHIQRWWRQTRLKYAAPLTLTAMVLSQHQQMLQDYLDLNAPPSLFFAPEALQFLDFVIVRAAHDAHLSAIARFERAIRVAAEAALVAPAQGDEVADLCATAEIKQHPAASLVELRAPAERLLGALLTGEPLPPPDEQSYMVLSAPGLPHWWRPAEPQEVLLFNRCQSSITVEQLLSEDVGTLHTLGELIRAGALCIAHSSSTHVSQRPESEH